MEKKDRYLIQDIPCLICPKASGERLGAQGKNSKQTHDAGHVFRIEAKDGKIKTETENRQPKTDNWQLSSGIMHQTSGIH